MDFSIAKLENSGFEPKILSNIKKAYIIDNKLRLLGMYKYTLADKNIHLHTYKLHSNIGDIGMSKSRSSHQSCSMKTDVLRNFTKFTGKHLCQSLLYRRWNSKMVYYIVLSNIGLI